MIMVVLILHFFLLSILCYLSFPYAIFMLGIAYLSTHGVYEHVICVLNKPCSSKATNH